MAKKSEITQNDFERLLAWLDKDRDAAARKYASIYRRLVQIFLARKAFPAEELADRTMDVAIQKIDYLVQTYTGDPALYFYNVAHKIFLEHLRKPKPESLKENLSSKIPQENTEEVYTACLHECLKSLSPEKRELFINYCRHEKQTKIKNHKKMAQGLGLDLRALRTRIYRIRIELGDCIRECFQKKSL